MHRKSADRNENERKLKSLQNFPTLLDIELSYFHEMTNKVKRKRDYPVYFPN